MMSDRSDQAVPKISSLQRAKIIMPNQKVTEIMLGPKQAPEIYVGDAYDCKVDTWSYGVILYYLLAGTSHFPELDTTSDRKTVAKMYRSFKPDWQPLLARKVTQLAIDLVRKCLVVDPDRRLTMHGVLKHAWF